MATGASNADLALVLIDARKGVLTQTRRHSFILSPDRREARRAGGQQDRPRRLRRRTSSTPSRADYRDFAETLGFETLQAIPVSALKGDNILEPSAEHALVPRPAARALPRDASRSRPIASAQPLRFPVQWVNRPNLDFRGFSGTRRLGRRQGRRRRARRRLAQAGQGHPHRHHGRRPAARPSPAKAVTLVLDREVDISRGDVLVHPGADARILQPVPGAHGLDERRAGLPRPLLSAQDRRAAGAGLDHRPQVPHQRQHARGERRQDARAQRSRHRHHRHRQADRLRQLRDQRADRRLHPHRPHLQRHARRRRHRLRPAPGAEPQLPVLRREPRRCAPR